MGKVVGVRTLIAARRKMGRKRKKVVFTNGTFDILHRGHVEYLTRARKCGDVLIVGLNTDASIRRIKGKGRPINKEADRAIVLSALASVDYVCLFGEDTPRRLIGLLQPDVLVKGADWKQDAIVGSDIVLRRGGTVKRIRLTPGRSTSSLIERIKGTRSGHTRRQG
jgi:D-beta-D-heptose 7-phosphate kinase/D-beta-D-heptose 1-phosphate adenosyltransferase